MDKYVILMATYNGAEYITEMLDSLESQTRQDFKCYIHDDGSTDDTVSIIENWIADKKNYELMEFEPCGGAKYNFMEMLSRLEADYYMMADQDDVWAPTKVEKLIHKIEQVTRDRTYVPCAVHCDMFVVDDNLTLISDSFIKYIGRDIYRNKLSQLLIDNPAAGTTMIINKALRDKAIECNDVSKIPMHDQWIMCVAAATGMIHVIDEPLVYYRQHSDNVMGAKTESRLDKVVRNARDIVTGEFARGKREFHQTEIDIASQLMYVSGIDNETRKFLIEVTRLNNCNKLQRMEFYRKNGMNRANHSLWMRLWV